MDARTITVRIHTNDSRLLTECKPVKMRRLHYGKDVRQLLAGVIALLFCILMIEIALTGQSVHDRDCTPVLLIFPIAVVMIADSIVSIIRIYLHNKRVI